MPPRHCTPTQDTADVQRSTRHWAGATQHIPSGWHSMAFRASKATREVAGVLVRLQERARESLSGSHGPKGHLKHCTPSVARSVFLCHFFFSLSSLSPRAKIHNGSATAISELVRSAPVVWPAGLCFGQCTKHAMDCGGCVRLYLCLNRSHTEKYFGRTAALEKASDTNVLARALGYTMLLAHL